MYSEKETLTRVAGLSARRLHIWLERGWISATHDPNGLRFGDIDVARLQLICTLQDDMEVDEDLLPTLLSLLDQVYGLRRELRGVLHAIAAQPEGVRHDIMARIQT